MRKSLFLLILLFSCKEKRIDSVKTVNSIPECDTASIMLYFSDNRIPDRLKDGLMAIYYKGVEEDFISVFYDTGRTYPLHNHDYICLKKAELYKYYAGPADTLFGVVYQKGIGYSQAFDIVLSKNINHINLNWSNADEFPGVPEELMH
jgi:hypothetical protein